MAKFIALARPNKLTAWVNPDNIAFISEYGDDMASIQFVGIEEPVVVNIKPDEIMILVDHGNSSSR